MKEKLLSTLLHTIEVAVVITAAFMLTTYLDVPIQGDLLALVLVALTKFVRTNTKDYVNNTST